MSKFQKELGGRSPNRYVLFNLLREWEDIEKDIKLWIKEAEDYLSK